MQVDFRKEYARFAIQSIVAAYVYEHIDLNGNGELTDCEVLNCLRNYLGSQLTAEELLGLSVFILTTVDQDQLTAGQKVELRLKKKEHTTN